MLTSRERVLRVLTFQDVDYIPNMEWGAMDWKMVGRWREEGMPKDVGLGEFFGWEGGESIRFAMYDPIPGVPDQGTVEEKEDGLVQKDCWGSVSFRPKGKAAGAYHVTRPGITDQEDWNKLKDQFNPDEPLRYPNQFKEGQPPLYLPWHTHGPTEYNKLYGESWENRVARTPERTRFLEVEAPSMFGEIKEIMGFENYCLAIFQMPELVQEIMETRTQLAEILVSRMRKALDFDILHFWEDIAFNSGPMVPPDIIESWGVPRYKRVIDAFKKAGGEIISVDCDGDIHSLRPIWLKAGINHLWPMEVNAGMKVDVLRKEYGHAFSMRGGIAKGAVVKGKDAIDRELDRIAPVVQDGGYIPMLDHTIEPDTPFDNFCYYMEQKRKLIGAPAPKVKELVNP